MSICLCFSLLNAFLIVIISLHSSKWLHYLLLYYYYITYIHVIKCNYLTGESKDTEACGIANKVWARVNSMWLIICSLLIQYSFQFTSANWTIMMHRKYRTKMIFFPWQGFCTTYPCLLLVLFWGMFWENCNLKLIIQADKPSLKHVQ